MKIKCRNGKLYDLGENYSGIQGKVSGQGTGHFPVERNIILGFYAKLQRTT